MARDEFLQHLASVPLFSNCTKRQLQEIGTVATQLNLPAGKVLARQGEAGRELFILLDGTASVTRDGRRVATRTLAMSWGNWPSFRVALATPLWWPIPNCGHWFSLMLAWTNFSTIFPGWLSTCSMRSRPGWKRQPRTSCAKCRSMAIPRLTRRRHKALTIPLVPHRGTLRRSGYPSAIEIRSAHGGSEYPLLAAAVGSDVDPVRNHDQLDH